MADDDPLNPSTGPNAQTRLNIYLGATAAFGTLSMLSMLGFKYKE